MILKKEKKEKNGKPDFSNFWNWQRNETAKRRDLFRNFSHLLN